MEKIIPGHEGYDEFNKRIFKSSDEFEDFFYKAMKIYSVPSEQYEDGRMFSPKIINGTICFGNLWIKAQNKKDVMNILKFKEMLENTCEVEHCGFDISLN